MVIHPTLEFTTIFDDNVAAARRGGSNDISTLTKLSIGLENETSLMTVSAGINGAIERSNSWSIRLTFQPMIARLAFVS